MAAKIIAAVDYVNHPQAEGVYLKHFYSSADNDRLSNVEVRIEPGCRIGPHIHEQTTEFYYLVEGEGDFLIDGQWHPVRKGYAMKVPPGEEHAIVNTGSGSLVIFSTFSPPNR